MRYNTGIVSVSSESGVTILCSETMWGLAKQYQSAVLKKIATNTWVLQLRDGLSGAGVSYSTDEQVVGTWIDGKPIYQKTVTGTTAADSNPQSVYVSNNIDVVTGVEGFVQLTFNQQIYANSYSTYFYVVGSPVFDGVSCTCSGSEHVLSRPYTLTVQYTKTTD